MNNNIRILFNRIKLSYILRRTITSISFNNRVFLLVKLLYEEGFITGYNLINDKGIIKIIIYLKYVKGRPFFKEIKPMYSVKKKPFFYNKIYFHRYMLNKGYFIVKDLVGNYIITGLDSKNRNSYIKGGEFLGKIVFS